MKAKNFVKAHELFMENAEIYLKDKIDFSKIENEYFFFFPSYVGDSPTSKNLRMVVENGAVVE